MGALTPVIAGLTTLSTAVGAANSLVGGVRDFGRVEGADRARQVRAEQELALRQLTERQKADERNLAEQTALAGPLQELTAKVLAAPDDHQARYDLALSLLAAGRRQETVDHLLEIVKRQRGWNEEAARKQLVKLFETFGPMDPLTIDARKRLSSILFA